MRAWNAAARTPWFITEPALRTVLEVAARQNEPVEAIEARLGEKLENTRRVTVRDGVAIVPVTGPLFRYANLFTRISGATSYQDLALDFTTALEDPDVGAILLNIDSPGGEVNGLAELADLIYAAREAKPVVAYVGGTAASAAYWLASATEEVVISETALLGSIGAVAVFIDTSERDRKAGIEEIEIVSSQSPKKRPNPAEPEGRAQLQATIDDLGEVFVSAVARNRGVSPEVVLMEFGQGDVFVGTKAVTAGLADRMGSFEGALEELIERTASDRGTPAGGGLFTSSDTEEIMAKETGATPAAEQKPAPITAETVAANHPEIAAHFRVEGATAERTRLLGIEEFAAEGHEALITECKQDGNCTPEMAAARILRAQKEAGRREETASAQHLQAMEKDEEELNAPSAAGEPAAETEDAIALAIINAGKPAPTA